MSNIIFLNHDEARDEASRRQVRARAAEYSHRVGPRKPKARKRSSTSKSRRLSTEDGQESNPIMLRRGSSLSIASITTSRTSDTQGASDLGDDYSFSPAPASPLARLGSYADEPFDSYPVPYQVWFPEILDYMWDFMLRGWVVLRTTHEQRQEALLWVKRLTMQDPTYFYMNMLSVSGDLASRGRLDPRRVVWLTGEVVTTINKALSEPQRALAVGTILSVGRLALREIMIGDLNAGMTFHRPAFTRMIVMAGGVDTLGLPALVKAHVAWGDRMMTRKTGVRAVTLEPSLAQEPVFGGQPDNSEGDMNVLDTYLPFRGHPRGPNQGTDGDPSAGEDASLPNNAGQRKSTNC